jgi:hypothetical protein
MFEFHTTSRGSSVFKILFYVSFSLAGRKILQENHVKREKKQEIALPVYIFSNSTTFLCFGKMFADNTSLSQSLSLGCSNVGS